MRNTLIVWMALLAVGVGSASVSWVRTDNLGNGAMGIQLARGYEIRIEFTDRDSSGDLSLRDLGRRDSIGSPRLTHLD